MKPMFIAHETYPQFIIDQLRKHYFDDILLLVSKVKKHKPLLQEMLLDAAHEAEPIYLLLD